MKSSIGWHTANIFMKITRKEAAATYKDFVQYGKETGKIRIRPIHTAKVASNADPFIKKLFSSLSKISRMEYLNKDNGIRWELRQSLSSPGYITMKLVGEDKPCSIKAKINPKILNGETDYLTAANYDCLKNVSNSFDVEAAKISPLLKSFDSYDYNRIDYCFNGDMKELQVGCTAEQMMKLIKRGNIPKCFNEQIKYDRNSHRKKPYKYSFYLKSNSVVINCYCKSKQLEEQYPDNICLEESRNLIRFEVQCKYSKVYAMSSAIKKENSNSNSLKLKEMLSDKFCEDIIAKYFHAIVRKGHYFTLGGARTIIEAHNFRRDKEVRLINSLELISKYRGIAKAKSEISGEDLKDFKRSLKDLDDILLNPVTIPRDWGIDYIPNLLHAYYSSIFEEQFITSKEFMATKYISEYLLQKNIKYKY